MEKTRSQKNYLTLGKALFFDRDDFGGFFFGALFVGSVGGLFSVVAISTICLASWLASLGRLGRLAVIFAFQIVGLPVTSGLDQILKLISIAISELDDKRLYAVTAKCPGVDLAPPPNSMTNLKIVSHAGRRSAKCAFGWRGKI